MIIIYIPKQQDKYLVSKRLNCTFSPEKVGMRFLFTTLITVSIHTFVFTQSTIEDALKKFNKNSVDYITVDQLKKMDSIVLFDTRKKEEFAISHLKDAVWVGYKSFNVNAILEQYPSKDTPIVVYCSIGVRSENIGEKLIRAGYTNVKNLYGGIFEWVNHENPIFDSNKTKTEKIHAFSKHWGQLLTNGQKVYNTKSKRD